MLQGSLMLRERVGKMAAFEFLRPRKTDDYFSHAWDEETQLLVIRTPACFDFDIRFSIG